MDTIVRVGARAYRVPTPAPEADGALAWDASTIVVAGDVHELRAFALGEGGAR
jgi:hypothetical protein